MSLPCLKGMHGGRNAFLGHSAWTIAYHKYRTSSTKATFTDTREREKERANRQRINPTLENANLAMSQHLLVDLGMSIVFWLAKSEILSF